MRSLYTIRVHLTNIRIGLKIQIIQIGRMLKNAANYWNGLLLYLHINDFCHQVTAQHAQSRTPHVQKFVVFFTFYIWKFQYQFYVLTKRKTTTTTTVLINSKQMGNIQYFGCEIVEKHYFYIVSEWNCRSKKVVFFLFGSYQLKWPQRLISSVRNVFFVPHFHQQVNKK